MTVLPELYTSASLLLTNIELSDDKEGLNLLVMIFSCLELRQRQPTGQTLLGNRVDNRCC